MSIIFLKTRVNISVALRDLLSFVQFKNREKHPWRSDTFSKANATHYNNTVLSPFEVLAKFFPWNHKFNSKIRGVFRTLSNSKMERFAEIVNDYKPLTIFAKCSIDMYDGAFCKNS